MPHCDDPVMSQEPEGDSRVMGGATWYQVFLLDPGDVRAERLLVSRSVLSPHWVRLLGEGPVPTLGVPTGSRRGGWWPQSGAWGGVGQCPPELKVWRTPERAQGLKNFEVGPLEGLVAEPWLGEAAEGEGLVPTLGGPKAWRRPGDLRVVPEEGCRTVSPPELVVEDPLRGLRGAGGPLKWCRSSLVVHQSLGTWGGLGPGTGLGLTTAPARGPPPCQPRVLRETHLWGEGSTLPRPESPRLWSSA